MLLKTCLRICLNLVLLRSIVNAVEVFGAATDYSSKGIFSWVALRLQQHWIRARKTKKLGDLLFQDPSFFYLTGLQLTLSVLLFILPVPYVSLIWLVFLIEILTDLRNSAFGRDGSDRMHLVVFFAVCLCYSFSDPRARAVGLVFIAAQAMIAYFVSGLVKVLSKQWRSGQSMALVLCSENYGVPRLGAWIKQNKQLCLAACWSVILFEMLFPVIVLCGTVPALCVLAVGVMFHFSVAATMGLNGFVWSFPATYPAIVFLSLHWERVLTHFHTAWH